MYDVRGLGNEKQAGLGSGQTLERKALFIPHNLGLPPSSAEEGGNSCVAETASYFGGFILHGPSRHMAEAWPTSQPLTVAAEFYGPEVFIRPDPELSSWWA